MSLFKISNPNVFLCDGVEFVMNFKRNRWQKRRPKDIREQYMYVTENYHLVFHFDAFSSAFLSYVILEINFLRCLFDLDVT